MKPDEEEPGTKSRFVFGVKHALFFILIAAAVWSVGSMFLVVRQSGGMPSLSDVFSPGATHP